MNKPLPGISKTLLSSEDITRRVAELARQIDDNYHTVNQLLVLGILRGAFIFIADLTRQLQTTHVVDSGHTLNHLCRTLLERQPASLRTCVLVRKKRANVNFDMPIDYIGFEIPDVWVVGYGLDYDNYYRTLPYIAEL